MMIFLHDREALGSACATLVQKWWANMATCKIKLLGSRPNQRRGGISFESMLWAGKPCPEAPIVVSNPPRKVNKSQSLMVFTTERNCTLLPKFGFQLRVSDHEFESVPGIFFFVYKKLGTINCPFPHRRISCSSPHNSRDELSFVGPSG